jgi:hypothetical protein
MMKKTAAGKRLGVQIQMFVRDALGASWWQPVMYVPLEGKNILVQIPSSINLELRRALLRVARKYKANETDVCRIPAVAAGGKCRSGQRHSEFSRGMHN